MRVGAYGLRNCDCVARSYRTVDLDLAPRLNGKRRAKAAIVFPDDRFV